MASKELALLLLYFLFIRCGLRSVTAEDRQLDIPAMKAFFNPSTIPYRNKFSITSPENPKVTLPSRSTIPNPQSENLGQNRPISVKKLKPSQQKPLISNPVRPGSFGLVGSNGALSFSPIQTPNPKEEFIRQQPLKVIQVLNEPTSKLIPNRQPKSINPTAALNVGHHSSNQVSGQRDLRSPLNPPKESARILGGFRLDHHYRKPNINFHNTGSPGATYGVPVYPNDPYKITKLKIPGLHLGNKYGPPSSYDPTKGIHNHGSNLGLKQPHTGAVCLTCPGLNGGLASPVLGGDGFKQPGEFGKGFSGIQASGLGVTGQGGSEFWGAGGFGGPDNIEDTELGLEIGQGLLGFGNLGVGSPVLGNPTLGINSFGGNGFGSPGIGNPAIGGINGPGIGGPGIGGPGGPGIGFLGGPGIGGPGRPGFSGPGVGGPGVGGPGFINPGSNPGVGGAGVNKPGIAGLGFGISEFGGLGNSFGLKPSKGNINSAVPGRPELGAGLNAGFNGGLNGGFQNPSFGGFEGFGGLQQEIGGIKNQQFSSPGIGGSGLKNNGFNPLVGGIKNPASIGGVFGGTGLGAPELGEPGFGGVTHPGFGDSGIGIGNGNPEFGQIKNPGFGGFETGGFGPNNVGGFGGLGTKEPGIVNPSFGEPGNGNVGNKNEGLFNFGGGSGFGGSGFGLSGPGLVALKKNKIPLNPGIGSFAPQGAGIQGIGKPAVENVPIEDVRLGFNNKLPIEDNLHNKVNLKLPPSSGFKGHRYSPPKKQYHIPVQDLKLPDIGDFYDGYSDDVGLVSSFSYFRNPEHTKDLDEYFSNFASKNIAFRFHQYMVDHSGFPGKIYRSEEELNASLLKNGRELDPDSEIRQVANNPSNDSKEQEQQIPTTTASTTTTTRATEAPIVDEQTAQLRPSLQKIQIPKVRKVETIWLVTPRPIVNDETSFDGQPILSRGHKRKN